MRILTIGDIHGCTTAFDALIDAVKLQSDDLIITLGDYVDRGPDSQGVIERLIALYNTKQLVPLLGNHEIMMLEARSNMQKELQWLCHGGDKTIASYFKVQDGCNLTAIPKTHWEFIEETCLKWYETKAHFFVHANAYPNLSLAQQPDYMLFWERFNRPAPHFSGKTMICGHTSQKSGKPRNIGHAICIDTWVYGKGWLTCLDVNSGKVWQANQAGKQRTAQIDEFA